MNMGGTSGEYGVHCPLTDAASIRFSTRVEILWFCAFANTCYCIFAVTRNSSGDEIPERDIALFCYSSCV